MILASAFGLGLSPIAPGSFGALFGVAGHLAIVSFIPGSAQIKALFLFFIVIAILNHLLTPWATRYWESDDPQHFVLDEVAGYLVVPILFGHGHLWQIVVWGFLLFRVLDIIKLPPARQIDRCMGGAWGIILDDLVSGFYAVIGLYLLMEIGSLLGLAQWLVDPTIHWATG